MFPTILIVDDEPTIVQSLSGLLSDEGFNVYTASNGYEGLKLVDSESPDLVLLDIWMPGIDGIETLKEIKKSNPLVQVIIITGHGNVETAVKATKLGAFDLIEKPLNIDKVIVSINNALNFRRLEEENRYLRKKTLEKHSISGNSAVIQELRLQIGKVAPTDSWVLIKGENGTGKELVARTIHQMSARAEGPLIDVNCAAIPDELIESELFGHEKDSIPSAKTKKRGKFELADKGTIFLDEIGDMSLKTQAKILRVLQEKTFQRVGGERVITTDVRVIAATNKDLETEIQKGRFREDLYYRLNVVPIQVPPLRHRLEDLQVLMETFLVSAGGDRIKTISEKALGMLSEYTWPGNVRELKNLVERLVIMTTGDVIEPSDIPAPYNPEMESDVTSCNEHLFSIDTLKNAKSAFELEFIRNKLKKNNGDIALTATAIGVDEHFIQAKVKKAERKNKDS